MLFASLGFAWTAGYEPPGCLSSYSVLGYNFTATTAGQALGCSANTSHYYGLKYINYTASATTIDFSIINASGTMGLGVVKTNFTLQAIPTTTRQMIAYGRSYPNGVGGCYANLTIKILNNTN
jgi:hypothetical protein